MIAEVTVAGIDFYVEFDYQPKEAETLTYPGCNESIDITGVSMQGIEVGERSLTPTGLDALKKP